MDSLPQFWTAILGKYWLRSYTSELPLTLNCRPKVNCRVKIQSSTVLSRNQPNSYPHNSLPVYILGTIYFYLAAIHLCTLSNLLSTYISSSISVWSKEFEGKYSRESLEHLYVILSQIDSIECSWGKLPRFLLLQFMCNPVLVCQK